MEEEECQPEISGDSEVEEEEVGAGRGSEGSRVGRESRGVFFD